MMILMMYVIVCEGLRVFLLCHRQLCCILYTTICDLECMVTGIPHEVGDLMFRIEISKRSRLASKADANQTMDIPANSVQSLFEIISMCYF